MAYTSNWGFAWGCDVLSFPGSICYELHVGFRISLGGLLRGILLDAQLELHARSEGVEGTQDCKTISILPADAPGGAPVNHFVLDKSPVQTDGYEVAVAAVLFETGDRFVQKFGFEDDDADLVADPFTHLRGFGSEGDSHGLV